MLATVRTESVCFPRLFAPGSIGSLSLKNRIVMAPMGTQLASETGRVTERLIDHYRRRAEGGAGLIIVEFTCVDYPRGKGHASQLSLHHDGLVAGHRKLVDAIHRAGARASVQLHHAGGVAERRWTGALRPAAPSPMSGRSPDDQPHVLSTSEIEELVERFARAVERARMAGYDSVEFHGAHGYLLAQFLSPHLNRRRDGYGGSVAKRLRFPLEVIRRSKELVGTDFPLTFRLSGREFVPGGRSLGESKVVAHALEAAGIAGLHVSAGVDADIEWMADPIYHPQGSKVHLAAAIKTTVGIPVIAVGVIREPGFAESVLEQGSADFVAIGRGLLVDPDWALKAANGRAADIRRCFSCNYCIDPRVNVGLSVRCVMNPDLGDPTWAARLARAPRQRRKILVVGGGPAGMEAARVAAARGHEVSLWERSAELGGQLLIARRALGKEKIDWLLDHLRRGLSATSAQIRTGAGVTREIIDELAPDVVVLAMGAKPVRPPLPGVVDARVTTAWEIIAGTTPVTTGRALVIGGDATGVEVALLAAAAGAQVELVEQREGLALDMEPAARSAVLKQIRADRRLSTRLGWRAVAVGNEGVELTRPSGESLTIPADQIVLAVGVSPVRDLLGPPGDRFRRPRHVYRIGDCARPGNIAAALGGARNVACRI